MTTRILRSVAALLGATILSVTFSGRPAHAQDQSCPCFTGSQVDGWFQDLQVSVDRPQEQRLTGRTVKLTCVDAPTFLTFDYLDRSEPSRSIYIDVSPPRRDKSRARCLVEPSPAAGKLVDSEIELTGAQASACRNEIMSSGAWTRLACPNN